MKLINFYINKLGSEYSSKSARIGVVWPLEYNK